MTSPEKGIEARGSDECGLTLLVQLLCGSVDLGKSLYLFELEFPHTCSVWLCRHMRFEGLECLCQDPST